MEVKLNELLRIIDAVGLEESERGVGGDQCAPLGVPIASGEEKPYLVPCEHDVRKWYVKENN